MYITFIILHDCILNLFACAAIVILIFDIDRYGLLCGDEVTVIEALDGATPYCTLSGLNFAH